MQRKKELFGTHYQNKDTKRAKQVAPKFSSYPSVSDEEEGRFRIAQEDTIFDIFLGDSGSDFNATAVSTFNKVKSVQPSICFESLKEPINLVGAFKTNKGTFSASAKVKLCITIFLPGSNVTVRGLPFLKAISFDLKQHLQRIHKLIHGKHFEEIKTN